MNIKKNDIVVILTGKDKGKQGAVVRSLPKMNKVIVEGLNMTKKHQKPRTRSEKGKTVSVAMPIHASNVRLADKTAKAAPKKKKAAVKK